MSGIPILKKKLKSIRATGKLSRAMKTVSAVKFSRLNTLFKTYSHYAEQYRFLYQGGAPLGTSDTESAYADADCVIVMGSNRGFCGGFNIEIINFARDVLSHTESPFHLIVCGTQAVRMLTESFRTPDAQFIWDDVPSFRECESLTAYLSGLIGDKKGYRVKVIYPEYRNTMSQVPKAEILTVNGETVSSENDGILWIPDRDTVLTDILKNGFRTLLYGMILETALGAQAATLMTMRRAYDTAEEYCEALEREIHRKRQSEVTADVIETSSERGAKEEQS